MTDKTIRVAVITGKHPYDVPAFQRMWRELAGVDAYPQHLEEFASSPAETRAGYDVLVFFNFNQATPTGQEVIVGESTKASRQEARLDKQVLEALEDLGRTGQGIMVWHHSLLAWPEWIRWSAVCGMADRSFQDVNCDRVRTEVLDGDHPITRGLCAWEMDDEVYAMGAPDPGCRVLLGTDHPKSMRALAWTHQLGAARAFTYQSGHNAKAFGNESFRRVMTNALAWLAQRT